MKGKTVILANGQFPTHEIPLAYLRNAARIVCCDGAVNTLTTSGMEPFAIVGDCDSISGEVLKKYPDRIFRIDEQETNDLTKSVRWCVERGLRDIVILGATGKREDHTIGNISLLVEYAKIADVMMVTDTGYIYPALRNMEFNSSPGQQVSVFSINPDTEITSCGLKYPLLRRKPANWWEATLNEATSTSFSLTFNGGPLIVFITFH